jgi:hypothetical protein
MWMKDFLFLVDDGRSTMDGFIVYRQIQKEARMKKRIRINYIFWKEGPLLPRLLTLN